MKYVITVYTYSNDFYEVEASSKDEARKILERDFGKMSPNSTVVRSNRMGAVREAEGNLLLD